MSDQPDWEARDRLRKLREEHEALREKVRVLALNVTEIAYTLAATLAPDAQVEMHRRCAALMGLAESMLNL